MWLQPTHGHHPRASRDLPALEQRRMTQSLHDRLPSDARLGNTMSCGAGVTCVCSACLEG